MEILLVDVGLDVDWLCCDHGLCGDHRLCCDHGLGLGGGNSLCRHDWLCRHHWLCRHDWLCRHYRLSCNNWRGCYCSCLGLCSHNWYYRDDCHWRRRRWGLHHHHDSGGCRPRGMVLAPPAGSIMGKCGAVVLASGIQL